jgi:rod shape-determining protein MreC
MPFFLRLNKKLVVLICLIFFQLILVSIQVPLGSEASFFKKAVFSVFSPIKNGAHAVIRGAGNIWKGYFDLRGLHKENKRIQKEIFFLRLENRLMKSLLDGYEKKEEIQEDLESLGEKIVYSRVIGIDMTNKYKSVVINRGHLDGVEQNMIVLDKFGQCVGRIVDPVFLKEATVQLITDSESGTSVFNPKKVPGVISGNDDGTCLLKYIERTNRDVSEGDILTTNGFDHIYPPGIPVGKVLTVTPTEELFKHITVRPFFQIRNLDELAVIKVDPNSFF